MAAHPAGRRQIVFSLAVARPSIVEAPRTTMRSYSGTDPVR
ncbi:hypothetical protein [Amycolatopsis pittospori]|nr:hypothetical protein [Amycolatopsis pittospori]